MGRHISEAARASHQLAGKSDTRPRVLPASPGYYNAGDEVDRATRQAQLDALGTPGDHTQAQHALSLLGALYGHVGCTEDAVALNDFESRPLAACERCLRVFEQGERGPHVRACPDCRAEDRLGASEHGRREHGKWSTHAVCVGCILDGRTQPYRGLLIGGRRVFCSDAHRKLYARFRDDGGLIAHDGRTARATSPLGAVVASVEMSSHAARWLASRGVLRTGRQPIGPVTRHAR